MRSATSASPWRKFTTKLSFLGSRAGRRVSLHGAAGGEGIRRRRLRRNQADGRVTLEAEGARPRDAFVDAVQEKMHGYIRKVERSGGARCAVPGFVIK